jgi:FtsP/CotA-like multicopper oxidase with cupredoxin domain
VGDEHEYVKMFDPPNQSPATPERMVPTNPVPAFMASVVAGFSPPAPNTVDRRLFSAINVPKWDNPASTMQFFAFAEASNPLASGGVWPAPTIRVPRGVIFHGESQGAPPPHTIHWHGIEPTPINDGVGHCSMEIGRYLYQWQPNFIGTYFYHCHRNTVQHFDFGLYGMILVEPPDAFANPATAGTYPRRTAASLANFPQFPGFNGNALTSMDPQAHTIPYDVEALWVLDDVDSNWHALTDGQRHATFPASGITPGVDDDFHANAGTFFAFNDFNADYFFCTGVPFPGPRGGSATLNPAGPAPTGGGLPGGLIPAALNSGVTGMQVAINAQVNKTIFVRCLDAAYCPIRVTFPIDVVIIEWDGRALGVPPFNKYTHAYMVPAGTPIEMSTARRFGALMRSATAVNSFATVEFRNHLKEEETIFTGRIPIVIA